MKHSPSWEANRFSASQEFLRILWKPMNHYRSHKGPPPSVSWASSMLSIPPHPTSWRSILILSSHLRLNLPSGVFPSGFSTKPLYTPLLSLIRATCHAHLILFNFITRNGKTLTILMLLMAYYCYNDSVPKHFYIWRKKLSRFCNNFLRCSQRHQT